MTIDFANMNQRHLFLAYAIVFAAQFGYAGWVAASWRKLRRAKSAQGSRPAEN